MSTQELVLVPRDKYNKLVATAAEATAALNGKTQTTEPTHPVINTIQPGKGMQKGDSQSHNTSDSTTKGLLQDGHAQVHNSGHMESSPSHSHIEGTHVPASPSVPSRVPLQPPSSLSTLVPTPAPPHPPPGERAQRSDHGSQASGTRGPATMDTRLTTYTSTAATVASGADTGNHSNTDHGADNHNTNNDNDGKNKNGAASVNPSNSKKRHFNRSSSDDKQKARKRLQNTVITSGQDQKLGKRHLKSKAKPLHVKIDPDNANLKFLKNWVSY